MSKIKELVVAVHRYDSVYAVLKCMFSCLNHMWNKALLDCYRISDKMLLAISQDQSSGTTDNHNVIKEVRSTGSILDKDTVKKLFQTR